VTHLRVFKSLAARLDDLCQLNVAEAKDGEEVRAGTVLIAPGGRQMKVTSRNGRAFVQVTDDPPENGCRPSVDYLFRSAVEAFQGQMLGVIMTGMGRNGTKGCDELKQSGGYVFAQQEESCVVYGMPKATIEQGLADRVLPLGKIGPAIVRHVKRSRQA
jgi:two-component system chemotaxis response regulator CheB